jgi:hypothetical protein
MIHIDYVYHTMTWEAYITFAIVIHSIAAILKRASK